MAIQKHEKAEIESGI